MLEAECGFGVFVTFDVFMTYMSQVNALVATGKTIVHDASDLWSMNAFL